MTSSELINELTLLSAARVQRLRVVKLVLEDKANNELLVKIAFNVTKKISIKAFWVLEFIVKEDYRLILPHLDFLAKNSFKVTFGSAVRPLAKIIQILVANNVKNEFLTKVHKEKFAEVSFDWLISNHKVAIKAYSMYSLFLLGKEIHWIHTELKNVILLNIDAESAAYKSRGKITLDQIAKHNKME